MRTNKNEKASLQVKFTFELLNCNLSNTVQILVLLLLPVMVL